MRLPDNWERVGDILYGVAFVGHLKIMVPIAVRRDGVWYRYSGEGLEG